MAGDLAFDEHLLVMPDGSTTRETTLLDALRASGGRVLQRYGPRVAVLKLGPEQAARLREVTPNAVVAASGADLGDALIASLDDLGQIGAQAFAGRTSASYIEQKKRRPLDRQPWGTPEAAPPDRPGQVMPPDVVFGDTSKTLTGSIVVTMLAASGPDQDLQWTSDEILQIHTDSQTAMSWWMENSPPAADTSIEWARYPKGVVIINAQPGPGHEESVWMDPILDTFGYPPGTKGCHDLVEYIKDKAGAKWGYIAFFTKYPVEWFAYGYFGGPYLVMSPNGPPGDKKPYGNWGVENLDRIFAHETGHVFQAPDEYASEHATCKCSDISGIYNQPNLNCDACSPPGTQDCLMKNNCWELCTYTPWHLGFPFPSSLGINFPLALLNAPGACVLDGTLSAFCNVGEVLLIMSSTDGVNWGPPMIMPGLFKSSLSPAACVFGKVIYVFYVDLQTGNILYTLGPSFSVSKPVSGNIVSSQPPCVCVFHNRLFLFWTTSDAEIWSISTRDGQHWSTAQRINDVDVTPSQLAACVFDEKLFLFWRATNTSHRIYYSASSDGKSWPLGTTINDVDATLNTVSACVIESQLYLFWKGYTAPQIYFTVSTDGTTWPDGIPINNVDTPAAAPCAVAFRNVHDQPANPYLLFPDPDSNLFRYTA